MEDSNQQQNVSLSQRLTDLKQEWVNTIQELNNLMNSLTNIDQLLNIVYTKRQQAVENWNSTTNVYMSQARKYKQKYAELYNNFKLGQNGLRYSTESSLQTQCEANLMTEKEILDDLKNFTDYMWETVRTIDDLLYGIQHKIRIQEIQHGLKF